MDYDHDIEAIASRFDLPGEFAAAVPYGSGHINDTYKLSLRHRGEIEDYIVQRINHEVFRDCHGLMANVERVTDHLSNGLRLFPARNGDHYWIEDGDYWRVYNFVHNTFTVDVVSDARQAYEVAHTFGAFHLKLADFSGPRLNDTIPEFHNTRTRLRQLADAVEADRFNRAASVKDLIDWTFANEEIAGWILDAMDAGEIPERITHNDTKINNVLLDQESGKGVCVIDLDTVMPGSVLYDFGDFIRTATSRSREDERDLDKVGVELPLFTAVSRGYLDAALPFLAEKEVEWLPFSGRLIAYELGARFLTDYLEGDAYFKIQREGQNVDRTRVQYRIAESVREQEDEMKRIIRDLVSEAG